MRIMREYLFPGDWPARLAPTAENGQLTVINE